MHDFPVCLFNPAFRGCQNPINGWFVCEVSTTRALTCPETVRQRPCMTREIEAWLSDSRVGNNSVVDHRSRRPVLSALRNCVDRCRSSTPMALGDLQCFTSSSDPNLTRAVVQLESNQIRQTVIGLPKQNNAIKYPIRASMAQCWFPGLAISNAKI